MNYNKNISISLPANISTTAQSAVFGLVSVLSFFMPFLFGHPQWLVGTVVNACLFLAAAYLPKKYYLSLAIFPSLGVLARGLIFGPFTYFLVYFLPFVWIGNLILIFGFKNLLPKAGYVFSVFGAGAAKFLFLLAFANIYFKLSIVPALFLQTMGLNQLATALAGGLAFYIIYTWKTQHQK
jgi:hypothetical protein